MSHCHFHSSPKLPNVAKQSLSHELRQMHALGKRALARRELRRRQKKGVHGTLASLGIHTENAKSRLYEARRLAELYNERELERLCSLRNSKGHPLTKSHVLQLILVENREQRQRLIKGWVTHAWSSRQLQREVERVRPRHRYGGRTYAVPQSAREVLLVTERLAASWLRWASVVKASRILLDAKSKRTTQVRKAFNAAAQSINELHQAIRRTPKRRTRRSAKRNRQRA